jgi:AcrR family transcriptional regulator
MSSKQLRPGGRSARVQEAVHRAARELLDQQGRSEVTVPMIATRAGVTPSTIYRRWGDLPELLADVALSRMRPESEPADTGSFASDLQAWADAYADEISSPVGLAMMKDLAASSGCRCADVLREQLDLLVQRADSRGERRVDADTLLDKLVAPIVFRAVFGGSPMSGTEVDTLVRDIVAKPQPKVKA